MAESTSTAPADGHQLLAQVGLRATPPRMAIWQALREADEELDAVALLRRAQAIQARTSLGTVYRFLRELEQHGLASSRAVAHERSRWRLGPPLDAAPQPRAMAAMTLLAAALGYRLVRAG